MEGHRASIVGPYYRYINGVFQRQFRPLQQRLRFGHVCTVPGHVGDREGRRRHIPGLFDRWYKRPDRAHRLYWRTHR